MAHNGYKREPRPVMWAMKGKLIEIHGGCQICGEDKWKNLVVHHQVYRPNLELKHLRLLCDFHHNQLHLYCPGSDRDLPRFTDVYISGMREEASKKQTSNLI